jgi:sodium/bile acid cotransporter 7
MRARLKQYWFLLALAGVIVLGFGWPALLAPVVQIPHVGETVTFTALFLMALPLEAAAVRQALFRPAPVILATFGQYVCSPLLAFGAASLLQRMGFARPLWEGLIVVSVIPCTLASVVLWTRRAEGNEAAAVLVTLVTNLSCFVVTPLWIAILLGAREVPIPIGTLVQQLLLLVVLPIVLAQLLRRHRRFATAATKAKWPLGIATQFCVLAIVLVGSIKTSQKMSPADALQSVWGWVILIGVVLAVHVILFWGGYWTARRLRLTDADTASVAFAGSQKTLMVGMHVALALQVSILPMVIYHVGQLLIDTIFADWLRDAGTRASRARKG